MTRFTLRLPDNLHMYVKRIARAEQRSINDQIVYLLHRGVSQYYAESSTSQPAHHAILLYDPSTTEGA